jgi:hypothetical protein
MQTRQLHNCVALLASFTCACYAPITMIVFPVAVHKTHARDSRAGHVLQLSAPQEMWSIERNCPLA